MTRTSSASSTSRRRRAAEQAPATPAQGPGQAPAPPEDEAPDAGPAVGANLRRIRTARALSLDALSRASGVSRAMLSQVELGRSAPTITLLWKIARALDVPFSALISQGSERQNATVLRAAKARRLTSHDGRFSSRPLFPPDRARRVEFYELKLAPHATEAAVPHPPGTTENLVVHRGSVVITAAGERHELAPGDAIHFRADAPHSYKNTSAVEAVMYLVMQYAETVGGNLWSV
jgi:transcriptional regulator with XRE-family HTH domain